MPLLRVLVVELLPCFTDFLDDEVVLMSLDDAFDGRRFMAGYQHEPVPLADDMLVLACADVDRFYAGGVCAFAVIGHWRVDAVLLGAVFDLLIDTAEDLLISGGTLGEVHAHR